VPSVRGDVDGAEGLMVRRGGGHVVMVVREVVVVYTVVPEVVVLLLAVAASMGCKVVTVRLVLGLLQLHDSL